MSTGQVEMAAVFQQSRTASSIPVSFSVGDLFYSSPRWKTKSRLTEQTFCELWKGDVRKIAAARKRVGRPMKEELEYYEFKYCYIHGGQPFKTKGRGNTTFKQGFPFYISLRVNVDGNALEVKSVCQKHNHEVSKASYLGLGIWFDNVGAF